MQFNKPPLSSKLTQSTIKDMLYHHRRVYSAKAVIDTSAPKCLIQSVKYNDQNKKDHFREGSRPQSAQYVSYSSRASSAQSCHRTSQRTVQKPSGVDLVQKHSELFTQDRPFTPKILKSDTSSIMEKYRCYRAPQRKPTQDCTNSKQETSDRSKKNTEGAQDADEPSQGIITECSEEELNGTYLSASRQKSHPFCDSSSRASLEGAKSPIVMTVFAEEEFEYLNFIFAVTEDILSRKHMSDRVLDRMIKNHIDMNRLQLDEGKMRHLVEKLRGFLKEPTNISTSSTPELTNDLLNSLISCLESGGNQ
ncbi:spermatogenesis-associated protein 7-like [Solea solea]|uniref:spermatogenesis-associated protein 7-like n=1 Tax=Solea solea TaxID=90069 RepID=UPI00272A4F5C|nr:spermatogenesis-associated protein 7-like [Solea solea]